LPTHAWSGKRNARDRAIVFTRQRFGEFDEIELHPYPYGIE
jgi:hypothetical protein